MTATGIEVRRVTVTGFVTRGNTDSRDATFTLIYDGTGAVRVKNLLAHAKRLDESNIGLLLMVMGRVHIDKEGFYLMPELVRRIRSKEFPGYIQSVPCIETHE